MTQTKLKKKKTTQLNLQKWTEIMNTHLISEVHSWLTIMKQCLILSVISDQTKTTVRYCNKSQCMAKIKVATVRARCGEHYF